MQFLDGRPTLALLLAVLAGALAGCGVSHPASRTAPPAISEIPRALWLQARAIGRGLSFHPPVSGPIPGTAASFTASSGAFVRVFIGGRRWAGAPTAVPLTRHAEIVLEIGPDVPPHSAYTFPNGL